MSKKHKHIFRLIVAIWAMLIVYVLTARSKSADVEIGKQNLPQINVADQIEQIVKVENENLIVEIETEKQFYHLSEEERTLVESIVCGEAAVEPYEGKVAVASCLLNACLLEDKRPDEIRKLYKYSGWKPIEEFKTECIKAYGNTNLADDIKAAVEQVFDNGNVTDDTILWFYAPKYSKGEWHQTQRFVIEIAGHKFYAPWG